MKSISSLNNLLLVYPLTVASVAFSFDMTAFRPLESFTDGHIATSAAPQKERTSVGASVDYAGSVYVDPNSNRDHAIKDLVKTSVYAGHGLTASTSLHLGLHATDEVVSATTREELLGSSAAKRQNFSGLSLTSKTKFIDGGIYRLAAAAFVHTGTMQKESKSLSRDDKAALGWMLISSVGEEKGTSLNLNAGYRYRNSRQIGEDYMRNEAFYGAGVKSHVMPELAVFGTAQGHHITHAKDNGPMQSGSKKYKGAFGTTYLAGIKYQENSIEVGIFGGRAEKNKAFGTGTKLAGLQVNYVLNETRDMQAVATQQPRKVIPVKNTGKKGPLGEEKPVDFMDDLSDAQKGSQAKEELDDFQIVEDSIRKKHEKYPDGRSPDVVAEEELEKLKRTEELKQKREQQLSEKRQREANKKWQENQKKRVTEERKKRQEVRTVIEEYPEITEDDVNWNGLE